MTDGSPLRVTFEDRRLSEIQAWRALDGWEEAVLRRHLEVDFDGVDDLRARTSWPRVRTTDECGCLEFERSAADLEPHRVVTDGYGPEHPDGTPFQTMLTLTASGELLWLEFHRYGGDGAHRPHPESVTVFPFGERPG
jgi:hypothetical protein